MARNEATFSLLSTCPHATAATDCGVPGAVTRLVTLATSRTPSASLVQQNHLASAPPVPQTPGATSPFL